MFSIVDVRTSRHSQAGYVRIDKKRVDTSLRGCNGLFILLRATVAKVECSQFRYATS